MRASFRILKNSGFNSYEPITKSSIDGVVVPGSFQFRINNKNVPFDFNAFNCEEKDGVFKYETGRGLLFNEYEISEDFDEMLSEENLTRSDLTPQFLSSVSEIIEFGVDFAESEDVDEPSWIGDNTRLNAPYKIEILAISFIDIQSDKEYFVSESVINNFNSAKEKIYVVTTLSRVDYDLSVTTIKHGAFKDYADAVSKLAEVIKEFEIEYQKDIDRYAKYNKENPADSPEEQALYIFNDINNGYYCCNFGFEEHYESHQICIDEFELS
jgi:hypothetical protein